MRGGAKAVILTPRSLVENERRGRMNANRPFKLTGAKERINRDMTKGIGHGRMRADMSWTQRKGQETPAAYHSRFARFPQAAGLTETERKESQW